MRFVHASPADVAMAMLAARFGDPSPQARHGAGAGRTELLPFQRDAVERLRSILERRGGAVHADSVGLGKTHVAGALIRDALAAGRPVLVAGPAQLGAHWRSHLRAARGWDWRSHTSLSRGAAWRRRPQATGVPLLVVDEAHGFRNARSRRYRTLAELCAGADVLLITATPVNNSVFDFYNLLRLFASDSAFADIGVPDLRSAFEVVERGGNGEAVRRVAEDVVVRRTRAIVERYQRAGPAAVAGRALAFPRVAPITRLRYPADRSCSDADDGTLASVARLRFPVHALHALHAGTGAAELLRLSLLKRLESSAAAFAASMERYAALLTRFASAARDGLLLAAHDRASVRNAPDGTVQLLLQELVLRPWPASVDAAAVLRDVEEEARHVDMLRRCIREWRSDAKLHLLHRVLTTDLRAEQVLVFTEFRDTAVHLWRSLVRCGGVGLIHGSDARLGHDRAARGAVIRRFAPVANRARMPRPRERIRILIATDVLSEGLNLQDARVVISYDVPWNPVRLAQRIGRIDRLGSPHADVAAFTFTPDHGLDDLLGLMRRIRRKLRLIRAVGGDAPRFGGVRESSPREGAPDPLGSESVEALRAEYFARVARSTAPVAGGSGRPAAAGMRWGEATDGALCCFTAGTACWLLLVRRGARYRPDAEVADRILHDALAAVTTETAEPQWLATAARRARGLLDRRLADRGGTPSGRTESRAAAAVHRWLLDRPGGPSPEQCALADRLLAALTTGIPAATQRQVGRILARGLTNEKAIAELERAVLSSRAKSGTLPQRPEQPRLRAILHLLPVGESRLTAPVAGTKLGGSRASRDPA